MAQVSARLLALLFTLATLSGREAYASQTVNLAWFAAPEPDVAGYRLYFGTHSGQYDQVRVLSSLERADTVWKEHNAWQNSKRLCPEPPSTYYYDRVFGCFTWDRHGVNSLSEAVRRRT